MADVEVAVEDVDCEARDGEHDECLVEWDVGNLLQVGYVFDTKDRPDFVFPDRWAWIR